VPAFPSLAENDPDDVVWALTTAAALFRQQRWQEAIRWIERASAAARGDRAEELARAARALGEVVEGWSSGRGAVDPASISIPISIEEEPSSIEIASTDLEYPAPRLGDTKPPPRPIAAPPPRPRVFATTLKEAERPPKTAPTPVPVVPVRVAPPPRAPGITLSEDRPSPIAAQPAAPPPAREAPTEEPEPSSSAETRRMEDVPTKRRIDRGEDS
jgi:hypothetical protein